LQNEIAKFVYGPPTTHEDDHSFMSKVVHSNSMHFSDMDFPQEFI
jgi:hypothetical protein